MLLVLALLVLTAVTAIALTVLAVRIIVLILRGLWSLARKRPAETRERPPGEAKRAEVPVNWDPSAITGTDATTREKAREPQDVPPSPDRAELPAIGPAPRAEPDEPAEVDETEEEDSTGRPSPSRGGTDDIGEILFSSRLRDSDDSRTEGASPREADEPPPENQEPTPQAADIREAIVRPEDFLPQQCGSPASEESYPARRVIGVCEAAYRRIEQLGRRHGLNMNHFALIERLRCDRIIDRPAFLRLKRITEARNDIIHRGRVERFPVVEEGVRWMEEELGLPTETVPGEHRGNGDDPPLDTVLNACAGFRQTLAHLARRHGLNPEQPGGELVNALRGMNVLSRQEYSVLLKANEKRNRIVHNVDLHLCAELEIYTDWMRDTFELPEPEPLDVYVGR